METRANYILIGAFTLAGLLGLLGFILWFAQVELDRRFAYYDVEFTSVSGLSNASTVRFAGLPVGQVADVRLAPDRSGLIRVRLEVDAETPVRANSIATIESQGVTGVSYVGISPGTPDAPFLTDLSRDEIPQIPAGRSVLQTLSEDAPDLLTEALGVVRAVNGFLTEENRDRVDNILANTESASENFAAVLDDFSNVTAEISAFAGQIDRFNATLEALSNDLSGILTTADTALLSIASLSEETRDAVAAGQETLAATTRTVEEVGRFLAEDLPPVAQGAALAAEEFRGTLDRLGTETSSMLATFSEAGESAVARLDEASRVFDEASALIVSLEEATEVMEDAADDFDLLVTEDGQWLVDETRAVMAQISTAVEAVTRITETDVPVIIGDIRSATATAARVVEEVGADLSTASGEVAGLSGEARAALTSVTDTFARANTTLEALDRALAVGTTTLEAAERTFTGADRVINEDISTITADLRSAIAGFDAALAQVSEDIPVVTGDLRDAAQQAEATFREVARIVRDTGAPVSAFAADGLPQYTLLANETRALIRNLEKLTNQIARDPARFLLDRDQPEFRR
ncbi:MCE family protein [Litorisediminicola beolgyonensis]|uniref:MlaD family protein n=1 Tax=Litorisediminicola beolgyonensis TaxID=1173614 RepID=A0ABW3ZMU9_9RHOB